MALYTSSSCSSTNTGGRELLWILGALPEQQRPSSPSKPVASTSPRALTKQRFRLKNSTDFDTDTLGDTLLMPVQFQDFSQTEPSLSSTALPRPLRPHSSTAPARALRTTPLTTLASTTPTLVAADTPRTLAPSPRPHQRSSLVSSKTPPPSSPFIAAVIAATQQAPAPPAQLSQTPDLPKTQPPRFPIERDEYSPAYSSHAESEMFDGLDDVMESEAEPTPEEGDASAFSSVRKKPNELTLTLDTHIQAGGTFGLDTQTPAVNGPFFDLFQMTPAKSKVKGSTRLGRTWPPPWVTSPVQSMEVTSPTSDEVIYNRLTRVRPRTVTGAASKPLPPQDEEQPTVMVKVNSQKSDRRRSSVKQPSGPLVPGAARRPMPGREVWVEQAEERKKQHQEREQILRNMRKMPFEEWYKERQAEQLVAVTRTRPSNDARRPSKTMKFNASFLRALSVGLLKTRTQKLSISRRPSIPNNETRRLTPWNNTEEQQDKDTRFAPRVTLIGSLGLHAQHQGSGNEKPPDLHPELHDTNPMSMSVITTASELLRGRPLAGRLTQTAPKRTAFMEGVQPGT